MQWPEWSETSSGFRYDTARFIVLGQFALLKRRDMFIMTNTN